MIDKLVRKLYNLIEDEIKIMGERWKMKKEIQEILDSIEVQKNVTETFKVIDQFQKTQTCVFTFNQTQKSENAEISKSNNKHFVNLSTFHDCLEFSKKIFSSTILINDISYCCEDSLITTISFDEEKCEISLSDIYSGEKSNYYRMVLPLDKELNFVRLFDTYLFCFNKSGWSRELIKTYIEGREFHIYKLSNDNTKYLFIDCLSDIEYQKFYDQCVCILCSLGVLTGYFVENECYIVSANNFGFSSIKYREFCYLLTLILFSPKEKSKIIDI